MGRLRLDRRLQGLVLLAQQRHLLLVLAPEILEQLELRLVLLLQIGVQPDRRVHFVEHRVVPLALGVYLGLHLVDVVLQVLHLHVADAEHVLGDGDHLLQRAHLLVQRGDLVLLVGEASVTVVELGLVVGDLAESWVGFVGLVARGAVAQVRLGCLEGAELALGLLELLPETVALQCSLL